MFFTFQGKKFKKLGKFWEIADKWILKDDSVNIGYIPTATDARKFEPSKRIGWVSQGVWEGRKYKTGKIVIEF